MEEKKKGGGKETQGRKVIILILKGMAMLMKKWMATGLPILRGNNS
jgi:hypothetical protein